MRAKLPTSLGRSSRSSSKFAMDIPQHGCAKRPIIICAALRLRRDELHRTSGLRRAGAASMASGAGFPFRMGVG